SRPRERHPVPTRPRHQDQKAYSECGPASLLRSPDFHWNVQALVHGDRGHSACIYGKIEANSASPAASTVCPWFSRSIGAGKLCIPRSTEKLTTAKSPATAPPSLRIRTLELTSMRLLISPQ